MRSTLAERRGAANVRRMVFLTLVALAFGLALACSSASSGGTPTPTDTPTPTGTLPPAEASPLGQRVFAANCSACHGDMGQGQPNWHIPKADGVLPAPPLNGDGHTWHHGDGFLYRVVSQGGKIQESPTVPNFKSGMPAFGDVLGRDEIVAVLTHVKSLWGDKTKLGFYIRESQDLVSENDPLPSPLE